MALVVSKKWLPWFQVSLFTLNSEYESGAHRVQRVPVTESQGRVHTSTATVLVMPEVEEVEYDIDPKTFVLTSTTHLVLVDRTSTRLRQPFVSFHLPTNIKVEMQEERTQQKNREKSHEDHPCACG